MNLQWIIHGLLIVQKAGLSGVHKDNVGPVGGIGQARWDWLLSESDWVIGW